MAINRAVERRRGMERRVGVFLVPVEARRRVGRNHRGASTIKCSDVRNQVPNLHLGLPYARGNDHRPMESVGQKISTGDILLWTKVLFPVPVGSNAEGARPQRHELRRGRLG